MSTQAAPAANASPSPWPAVARAVALLTVSISLLLTAFAWPFWSQVKMTTRCRAIRSSSELGSTASTVCGGS